MELSRNQGIETRHLSFTGPCCLQKAGPRLFTLPKGDSTKPDFVVEASEKDQLIGSGVECKGV